MLSRKLKRTFIILGIVLGVIVMGVVGITLGYNYVVAQNHRFDALEQQKREITAETPRAVMILIESGDSTSVVAEKLEEKKLIDSETIFEIMSKYNGFDGEYQVGTHYLTPDLSYDEIMHYLCLDAKTVPIRFREGLTYIQVKQVLREKGLQFNEEKLDTLMNSPNDFVAFDFISKIKVKPDRDYNLSGYLFPDQYDFDVNASEKTIISTFLRNAEIKIAEEYYARAEYLGLTFDEVMTLASFIEAEAGDVTEMFRISGVFHNRLKNEDFLKLESCASINYIREKNGMPRVWYASDAEMAMEDPYNTYFIQGLPPGPICMPGLNAIQAALYPEANNYYFFCAKGDGSNAFAATKSEHDQNVATYESVWAENPVR